MIPGRRQKKFTEKILREMHREQLDAVILTAPDAIFYATGYASSFLYHSFNYGLTVLAIDAGGRMAMVLSEFEKQAASLAVEDVELISYPTWIYIEDYAVKGQKKEVQPDVNKSFRTALQWLPEKAGKRRVGIQYDHIKFQTWEYLTGIFPREDLVDLKDFLIHVRSVKTKWEIDVMREAAQISERAMEKTAREIEAGMTDTELSNRFRSHCLEQSEEIVDVFRAEGGQPGRVHGGRRHRRTGQSGGYIPEREGRTHQTVPAQCHFGL